MYTGGTVANPDGVPTSDSGDTSFDSSMNAGHLHNQSMSEYYGHQQNVLPVRPASASSHHSRSYSYQDIAALPGLSGVAAPYPSLPPHQPHPSYYPVTSVYGGVAAPGTVSPYPQHQAALDQYSQRERALQQWLHQYSQWWQYVQSQNRERLRQLQPLHERERLTPHLYPTRHSRVSFGGTNQLIVIRGTTVLFQQLDPSLLDYREEIPITSWPGPLIKGETNKDDVIEYIRALESHLKHRGDVSPHESFFKSHERRQLWSLLLTAVRQNGVLSGADLSDLLLENNESEFEAPEEGDDVGKVRRFLTLGQKKTALEFAQKTGLWGHVSSLILFNSFYPNPNGPTPSTPDGLQLQMCNMVSKFINATLSRDDPLFILYMCLLSKIQARSQKKPQQKTVITDNLQQFAILVANDCDVSPGVSSYGRSSELLKFMVNIRNNKAQHVINLGLLDYLEGNHSSDDIKYADEIVFMNEIWEFARDHTEFIEALVPLKAILASRLFDFGLINNASRYCFAIRQYHIYYNYYFPGKTIKDSSLDWDTLMKFVTELECRIYGYDVTSSPAGQPNPQPAATSPSGQTSSPGNKESRSDPRTQEDGSEGDSQEDVDEVEDEEAEEDSSATFDRVPVPSIPVVTPSTVKKQPLRRRDSDQSSVGNRNRTQSTVSQQATRTRTFSRESDHTTPSTPAATGTVPMIPTINTLSISSQPPRSFVPSSSSDTGGNEFSFVSSAIPSLPTDQVANGADDTFEGDRRGSFGAPHNIPFNSTQAPGSSTSFTSPFPSAFSPITSPEPSSSPPFLNERPISSNGYQMPPKRNDPPPHSASHDQPVSGSSSTNNEANKSGWFGNIFKKVSGPKQAVLPDDSNPSIVWDDKSKRWVDKNADPADDNSEAIRRGPPKIPLSSASLPSIPTAVPSSLGPTPSTSVAPGAMPPTSGANGAVSQFSYLKGTGGRRRPQYVDVWQQTQQQKQTAN